MPTWLITDEDVRFAASMRPPLLLEPCAHDTARSFRASRTPLMAHSSRWCCQSVVLPPCLEHVVSGGRRGSNLGNEYARAVVVESRPHRRLSCLSASSLSSSPSVDVSSDLCFEQVSLFFGLQESILTSFAFSILASRRRHSIHITSSSMSVSPGAKLSFLHVALG